MTRSSLTALSSLATLLLAASACQPDAPANNPATTEAAAPTDTLHLPGGRVSQLRPTTAAAFNQLPTSDLPDLPNDPAAEPLPAAPGRVGRQGLALLLKPAQGPAVKLFSTPDTEFTLQNGAGVKYMYWGSLPAAHQWVVRAWAWESAGAVLVDQRTGRRLDELPGDPVAAPDGGLVLLTSAGLGGGDQPNMLSLVQVDATGARLLWQREPTTWEPAEARWAAPNRVVLKRRHTLPDGSLPDEARVTYDELTLP